MAGNVTQGKNAAKTNKRLYGEDFYKRIGSKGGKAITKKPRGFAANPELAKEAGRKGGKNSRKNKKG